MLWCGLWVLCHCDQRRSRDLDTCTYITQTVWLNNRRHSYSDGKVFVQRFLISFWTAAVAYMVGPSPRMREIGVRCQVGAILRSLKHVTRNSFTANNSARGVSVTGSLRLETVKQCNSKELSPLNGHVCRARSIFEPFTGNGDVFKLVKNFRVRQTPNKQIKVFLVISFLIGLYGHDCLPLLYV